MKALAQLCCLVLMVLGLVFIISDVISASSMYDLAHHRFVWQWGMGAVFAGVVGTALLSIADALAQRAGPSAAAKPESKPQ
jgi:hypothetical protein